MLEANGYNVDALTPLSTGYIFVWNAETNKIEIGEVTGAIVEEYSAGPIFMTENEKGAHEWIIEFGKQPNDFNLFVETLDKKLQEINSDYEAKRYKNITLQPLEIVVARPKLFHDWLKEKGKLGGQHKVPRLSNSRDYIEEMLSLNH